VSGGAVQIDRLAEQLKRLKLARTADQLPALLQEASKKELPYTDFLEDLLGRELLAKQERHTASTRRSSASSPPAASSPTPTTCSCSARPGWARRTWQWRWG
jgi:DNA replication protein DnaC